MSESRVQPDPLSPEDAQDAPMYWSRAPFGSNAERSSVPVAVDQIDLRLLQLLLQDGRATLKSLAAEVQLSAPAVSERLNRLQHTGVIRGYSVDIDWYALGFTMVAYLNILVRPGYDRGVVLQDLQKMPNVEEISVVTGASDIILRMRTSGFEHLKEVIAEHIWSRRDLETTETRVAFTSDESSTVELARVQQMMLDRTQQS